MRARAGAQLAGREQSRGEAAAVEVAREAAAADARLLAHHLDERGDRLGAAGLAAVEPLEQREAVRDQHAARRRRRVRDDGRAAERRAHGAAPHDAVGGEIVVRELAAAVARRSRRSRAPARRVEDARAAARDRVERVGEIGQAERVAGDEPRAGRRVAVDTRRPRGSSAGSGRAARACAPARASARRRRARARSPGASSSRHGSRP